MTAPGVSKVVPRAAACNRLPACVGCGPGTSIGSAVGRIRRWQGKDAQLCEHAFVRARELLCGAMPGGKAYGSSLEGMDRYCFAFAVAGRANR